MYGDDAYIQPQAVGRERCVDLWSSREPVVQVEHAIMVYGKDGPCS